MDYAKKTLLTTVFSVLIGFVSAKTRCDRFADLLFEYPLLPGNVGSELPPTRTWAARRLAGTAARQI